MEKLLLIAHLMFIAMGTGMSFSNFVNVRLAKGQTGDIAKGLALQRRTMARIGDAVIALIWVSGLALLWVAAPEISGWFHAKLGFVVLLTLSHAMARRTGIEIARSGNTGLLSRLELYSAGVWISALAAILLAVVAFAA
jgi:uncharacterized membrane protein